MTIERALPGVLLLVATAVHAQEVALSYTAEQAARGKAAYDQACVACHGANLEGVLGPPLKGPQFIQKYGGKSVGDLYTVASTTMPTGAPASLGAATYIDLVAYMLQSNDIVAAQTELPADPPRLAGMMIPAGGFSFMAFSPYVAKPPVDEARLGDPPPGEWLSWRRTYDAHGFSPLTEITPRNVAKLRVAWTWSLPPGSNESVPLVHDGVMFAFGFGDQLQAIDARTG